LSKLRDVCNHPILARADGDVADADVAHSGKLAYLQELLEEIAGAEHRALLFSQSTRVLDIIENHLGRWGVRSLRIDGDTAPDKRLRIADEFNANPKITCFLLSTRAANTGLNLTGADTVIFYDNDWNPANDEQAIARAHRNGQSRNVTVYRLISKGTIEEKILARQRLKQTIADVVIDADAQEFKDLRREELLALFRLDADAD
jgi:SNF2 family DNA or RNA helicase